MQAIYNRAIGLWESNLYGELGAFPDISLVGSLCTLPSHKDKNSISQPLVPKYLHPGIVEISVTNHRGANILSDKTIKSSVYLNSDCKLVLVDAGS